MKIFIKSFLCLYIICGCVFFFSCSSNKYSDTLSCTDLTSTLQRKILGDSEYVEYSDSDVKYIFDCDELFDSCSIIYSVSSDDIGEIGILHAENEEKALQLLDKAIEHIKTEKKEKMSFLRNYLPSELEKLESADARKFGNYVVFVFLDEEKRDAVFDNIENTLKK